LFPNLSNAEATGTTAYLAPSSTGFSAVNGQLNPSSNYVYIAIRRGPMKTPTVGTTVYNAIARTGTGVGNVSVTGVGFPPDFALYQSRSGSYGVLNDRLRSAAYLLTQSTQQETSSTSYGYNTFLQDGAQLGSDTGADGGNQSSTPYANWFFRRAPGFFDVVAYTGTGSARTVSHNLGVVPELMIVKNRAPTGGFSSEPWGVYVAPVGNTKFLYLNADIAATTASSAWNSTTPSATVFTVGTAGMSNVNGFTYIAYLFASCPGVSKVGSYTGTGTTLQINCGFTAGARFVMIKRTDSTGDWYVWDTARGIISGNDPYLLLNSTAAEVTGTDYIDPLSSGFEISSTAPAAINASGGTYIYLSVA
jgi:hypothetical protein